MKKRTLKELQAMPKPQCPAELEVLTEWYFGKPLHLSRLYIGGGFAPAAICGATYEVAEKYNSYHGKGWPHSENALEGYDYSARFWEFVIGYMVCGGIGGHSYGQTNVFGHRDKKRLEVFLEYLRRKESGRLRKPFERLARKNGAGENTVTHDSRVQIAGRVDGAAAVLSLGV